MLIFGHKERTLDPRPETLVSEPLAPSTTSLSGAKLWPPIFGICDCLKITELQITLALAAEAFMTPTGDSFQDLSPERSPFPVDHAGFTYSVLSLSQHIMSGKRKQFSCKSVSPACRVSCCAVLNVTCQHHRANSSVRVPVPLITLHLWLVQISPLSVVGVAQTTFRAGI